MQYVYRYLFEAMWLAWGLYWWASSRDVKVAARTESALSRLSHVVPLMLAVALLVFPRIPIGVLRSRFVPAASWPFWVGAALAAAGLVFCVWARLHLGRNWSGIVTVKQDHELITSGPYAIVRHPIYTGLLLAVVGSALATGEWRGVVAVALVFAAIWHKLRIEERFMVETFGDAYVQYRRRVKTLLPFVL
jgi:protein-S-isoprenylcysteine O-methyltransferase Ste14